MGDARESVAMAPQQQMYKQTEKQLKGNLAKMSRAIFLYIAGTG
jgi:hypothetical protein